VADASAAEHDDLRHLGLNVQDRLHAQATLGPGAEVELLFLAAMPGEGVLVEGVEAGAMRRALKADAGVRIRGFNGCQDFTFATRVLQLFDYGDRDPPLAYALLAYPDAIETRQVRRARRVRVSLPATARLADGRIVAGYVRDLSLSGALFESDDGLAAVGAEIRLQLTTEFEGDPLELALTATVTRQQPGPHGTVSSGLEFEDVPMPDKLALHYLVSRAE
jgi:hypothetical protein